MDGVEQINNILVMGITNRPNMLDEALLRPSRMRVVIEVPIPSEAGRLEIFEMHTKMFGEQNEIKQLKMEAEENLKEYNSIINKRNELEKEISNKRRNIKRLVENSKIKAQREQDLKEYEEKHEEEIDKLDKKK